MVYHTRAETRLIQCPLYKILNKPALHTLPNVPNSRNTEDADIRAEQLPAPCAFVPRAADATIADAPDQPLSAAAAHSGRIVGMGFRPEHIATPDAGAAAARENPSP